MGENIQWAIRTSSKLGDFLRSGACSDIQLSCSDGEQLPCHKLILSLVSEPLKKSLQVLEQHSHTEVYLQYISDQPKPLVNEILIAFYTGKINITKSSYRVIYKIATFYEVDWLCDATRDWIEGSVVRLFGLEFLAFACSAANDVAENGRSDRAFLKLIDSHRIEEHFKNLKIDKDFEQWGLCGLDSGVVRNILKFSGFETDYVKISFVLYWLQTNQSYTKDMISVIMTDIHFPSLLRTDGDRFLEVEERIKEVCPTSMEKLVYETFGNAMSHTYVDKIKAGDIDDDLMAVDRKIFTFLMTSSELKDVSELNKINFAVQWLQINQQFVEESESLIMDNIDLDDLYASDTKLFRNIKNLYGKENQNGEVKPRFMSTFSNFKETISSSKKLLKLACSDRWKEFEREEILDMMQKFGTELDSYSVLGMFGEWIMGSEKRAQYKKSWRYLLKAFPNLESVHPQFLEDFKRAGVWNFGTAQKENSVWDEENSAKILKGLSTSDERYKIFYEGKFPSAERPTVPDEEANGVATIKRQAGQFTKGSRTVIFKSENKIIKIGFDESRTPYLFQKLQTGLTRARRASQEPADDISQRFVTVYAVIEDCFINLPFLQPAHLEDIISKTRENNTELRIVVIIKAD